MLEIRAEERRPEELVRQYFDGLRRGRVVDALDVFATDAVVRDERGREHSGIREIAASLVQRRVPVLVGIVSWNASNGRVTAVAEFRQESASVPVRYRWIFRARDGRVRSLVIDRP